MNQPAFGDAAGSPFHHCGQCQATAKPGAKQCWLCGAALDSIPVDAAATSNHVESRVRFQFSLASLMLLITLCAVVLGVFTVSPGIGIWLAILATPAGIRTAIVGMRKRVAGRPMSVGAKVWVFGGTLGLVAIIAVAVPAAFVVTCFPVGLAGFGANAPVLMVLAWPVGIGAGLLVLVLLFRLFRRLWPR